MPATIDLQEMTTEDKWRLMEELWVDLSRNEANVESPEWHKNALQERVRLIETGEEAFVDWEVAKRRLREELQ